MLREGARLQFYDSPYHTGKRHINANLLSCYPCRWCGCKFHTWKQPISAISTNELTCGHIASKLWTFQQNDSFISELRKAKGSDLKPSSDEAKAQSVKDRLKQLEQFATRDGHLGMKIIFIYIFQPIRLIVTQHSGYKIIPSSKTSATHTNNW